jgi:hypothetical protein
LLKVDKNMCYSEKENSSDIWRNSTKFRGTQRLRGTKGITRTAWAVFKYCGTKTVPLTLYPIDLGPHKINNTSCNYLGSFFIEKLSLKNHLINMKTAVHTTDPP